MPSSPQSVTEMDPPNSEERLWRVVGRIAGRYLPTTPIRIGDITVGPLPEGVRVLERPKGLEGTPTSDTYFIGRGGDVEVKSRCYFWIEKRAKSPELAISAALLEDIPLLQIAFSLRDDKVPYRVEIVFATDGKKRHSSQSSSIYVAFWFPKELSLVMLDDIEKDHQILKRRDRARNAAYLLTDAIRQGDITGSDVTTHEGTLLGYFKVIELIASHIPAEMPTDREKRMQEVLSPLQTVLNSNKSVSKKASAVQAATTSLSRLEGRYLKLKIDSAANKLKMSDGWKRAARELVNLRNTRLGHARSRAQGAEQALVQWNDIEKETGYTALRLAREMLMAYVDRARKDPH